MVPTESARQFSSCEVIMIKRRKGVKHLFVSLKSEVGNTFNSDIGRRISCFFFIYKIYNISVFCLGTIFKFILVNKKCCIKRPWCKIWKQTVKYFDVLCLYSALSFSSLYYMSRDQSHLLLRKNILPRQSRRASEVPIWWNFNEILFD